MRADAEALYHANQRGLFRYLCRAVGHAETARDLTQDVFVRVSRSVIPVAPEAALRGWLFQIARNLALDHHRSSQRRPQAEPLTDTARPASQDTSAQVNEALASLADVDRDVFLMREVAGLGYDEIATACGLTPDAVRSRIHRTRLQLRERLSTQIAVRQASPMRQSGKSDSKRKTLNRPAMTDTHAVISSFLDDDPFDAAELAAALSDPEGRALLIDLVALRHIVQPDEPVAAAAGPLRSRWRPLLATAAMLVALAGGYVIGDRRSAVERSEPPAPTRVVQETTWQILPTGGGR